MAAVRRPARLRILLVDDNADTLRALARLLRIEGHTVLVADGFAAALALGASPVDVLVTDLLLQDGTGWSLYGRLSPGRGLPAIAVSGSGMPEDVEHSLSLGFRAHLTKPIAFEALLDALDRCRPLTVAS